MKKIKSSEILLITIVSVCIVLLLLCSCNKVRNMDYDKANEKTKSLDAYSMTIDTIVKIDDGENVKQNAISQLAKVDGDIYNVETEATTTDVSNGAVSRQENSYMYYLDKYYYTYPGAKYTSPVSYDEAMANLKKLTNIISFDEADMVDLVKTYDDNDEYAVFNFTISYDAVSEHIKNLLQSAANTFENVNFSPVEIAASATVHKAGYVKERDLYVEYKGDGGESIVLEIYTSLGDAPVLEAPDASQYVNIVE